ncbi:MAG: DNA polymerase I [Candidatus Falkowbacteria bacterium]
MSKRLEKLLVIDGNALIHRSFHALPPTLTTKAGEQVNAVYGFAAVFIKAVKEIKPDYVVLTLDKKGPTFRHEVFKEYKATRVKAPQELYDQFDRVRQVATAFGVPIYEMSGFEADDLIGAICHQVGDALDKVVLTGDMDTMQLIDEHTKVYAMSRGINDAVTYDWAAVEARYGLTPEQIVDYKALRGDPSDNIPGVKGIGEKTAVELLQRFKSLDGLYVAVEKGDENIKERIRNLLHEHKERAYMSQHLALIKRDVEFEFDLAGSKFGHFNRSAVVELFSELQFKSLLARIQELGRDGGKESATTIGERTADKFARNRQEFKYHVINQDAEFERFLTVLKQQTAFTLDTETDSLDTRSTKLLGISFAWQKGEAYYLLINHAVANQTSKTKPNLFSVAEVETSNEHPWLHALKPILEDKAIKKYGHNIKFDLAVLATHGILVEGVAFDTMLASYLLNPGSRQHNLDGVTFSELGFEKISKDDLLGTGKNKQAFGEVSFERLGIYSCEDADFTNRLVKKLKPQLKEHNLHGLFETIEVPLIPVLGRMERWGISLDKNYLLKLSRKLHKQIDSLAEGIYAEAGTSFNINSPAQLQEILFGKLEIPTAGIGKTKTGLSTSADELEKLKELHKIVPMLLDYREYTKIASTYVDALPKLVNPLTGRIHTSYNQTIAATGRLSSSDPNLQNIPVKGDYGQAVRQAFVAQPGYELLALDYSQIELRLAAHMSGDEKMVEAFEQGLDIHTSTAAAINKVELTAVSKDMRRAAKAINFGILYGQGPHGLAQVADIPYWEAKQFIDAYFEVYPKVKAWVEQAIEQARESGYAETLFDRRRYLPELNSSVMQVRKAAERMAMNTPLQGTAADMIKLAMIQVDDWLQQTYPAGEVRMLLQVHDELVFEVKHGLTKKVEPIIKEIMEKVIELKVPVIVESKTGQTWGEME